MRILVTGASGPFGAHFAKLCLRRGHEVIGLRSPRSNAPNSAQLLGIGSVHFHWLAGEIDHCSNWGSPVDACLEEEEIDAVAHFAAQTTVTGSTTFSVNTTGTVALLDAVKARRPSAKFLYVGTDKEYGYHPERSRYDESTPLSGRGLYAASKVAADVACRAYQHAGLVSNLVVARVCNIIAPADLNERLVASTIRRFIKGESAAFYTRQYIRQYMHVDDAVEVLYQLLLHADESRIAGEAFNVGAPDGSRSQLHVIEEIAKHFTGAKVLPAETPDGVDLTPYAPLFCGKVQAALNWAPLRSFERSIGDAVAWWRERHATVEVLR